MKRLEAILTAGLTISLSSCVFSGKPKVAAAPLPPAPVTKPAPVPLPQPLSIPQTKAQLPPPQPLSPEALAATVPHEETPEAPAPTRTPPRRVPTPAPPKTEAVTPPAVTPPAVTQPPAEERAPIQEVLPPSEQRRLADEADASTRDALRVLDQVRNRNLSRAERSIVDRVRAFLKQADDAKQRGDMRQASELAARALVLAKELQP